MIRFADFSRLGSCSPGLASYIPYNFSPGFLARRGPQRNEPPLRSSCVGPYDTRAALARRRPAYTCLCSPQNAISRRATAPIPNSMRIASSMTNQAPPVQ